TVGVRDNVVQVDLERAADRRVGPLDLALVPTLVDVRSGGTQHDVLEPVSRRPAGGGAGLDAEAPRFLSGALVGRRLALQLVPRGRWGRRVVVQLRVVPDQALDR